MKQTHSNETHAKQSYANETHTNQSYANYPHTKLSLRMFAAAAACLLLLIGGASGCATTVPQSGRSELTAAKETLVDEQPEVSPSPDAALDTNNSPSPAPIYSPAATLNPGDLAAKLPELVPFTYTPLDNPQTIDQLQEEDIVSVLKELPFAEGTAFIYERKGQAEEVYAGYRSAKGMWSLGAAAGWTYRNNPETFMQETDLYGEQLLHFSGSFGAAFVIENYYRVEAGEPLPYLQINTGLYGLKADLEDDGIPELISSHITYSTIYKRDGDRFLIMNASEAFGWTDTIWAGDKLFTVQPRGGKPSTYTYTPEGFRLLH